jgi:hypothetical protein
MLRACLLTLLVAAAFPVFGPAAMAADPTAPATGQTESLKGTLRVEVDVGAASSCREAISAMLNSSAVSRAAAAKVCKQLKISANINDFELREGSIASMGAPNSFTVEVLFKVPQHDPPLAGPFLAAVAEQLQEKLRQSPGKFYGRLSDAIRFARENLEESRQKLAMLRTAQRGFYEKAGRTDLSRESIMAAAKALETEEQKLQMDQVGHTARQEALMQRIADIAAKAERRADEDPVAAELKKIVALRERELDLAKKRCDAGQMPTSEVGAIEIKVAEARAEWLKRREAAGSLAGRDLLAKLNEELSTLEVDNAETAARLDHIRIQLAENRKILPIADDYQDNLGNALRLAEREVQNALQQHSEAARRLRDFVPPTVVAVPSE